MFFPKFSEFLPSCFFGNVIRETRRMLFGKERIVDSIIDFKFSQKGRHEMYSEINSYKY